MSEEFDKEAEREKLREKLETDERKRQETQRMSELLLQGATMTNEHCEQCGDPLFRDGERTFCPTCGGAGDEGAAADAEESTPAGVERPNGSTEQSVDTDPSSAPQANDAQRATRAPDPATEPGEPTTVRESRATDPVPGADTAAEPRTELQRAVTRSARRANATDDPRTAKAWLEASKAAAEALAALERE